MPKRIDTDIYDFKDLLIYIAQNGEYKEEDKYFFKGIVKGMSHNLTREEINLIEEILK